MSTILRALKKLEQEKVSQQSNRDTIQAFNARLAVGRPIKAAWYKVRIVRWGLFSFGLALFSGLMIYYFSGGETPSTMIAAKPAQTRDQVPVTAAEPRAAAGIDTPSREMVVMPPMAAQEGSDAVSAVSEPPTTKPAPAHGPAPIARPSIPPIPQRPIAERPAPQPRPEPSPKGQPTTPAPLKPASPADEAFAAAERVPDGRLKIQAIAWAPDPQDRMAVIDNRILREGESVGGYTIVTIAEDQILFSAEGRRWKVIFGRR